ncbi:unnamed protein product [Rotaria socialis]|uniref:Uncharacterized protein n=1 Tax=Rotaria socialis TaxID=392032 RepID=A0A817XVF8_9BILA|nr:unnamed protein product [Rotaria socialis]CAF3347582.1 unnamed protein product [Rotaria socialis]CAF3373500.1 unnamed protein product [Rotaria socialis]CAF3448325.1 unnamed protein product [Rotaria socialis]CAF3749667.1 unnamed protein product [Rotaria socialis]
MRSSSLSNPPIPVDSIVINEISSQKPTTTLLHSSKIKRQYQHHSYNYWTLNERLRSKNEKLFKKQQSSCRFAFYSLLLFVFAGVMGIIVYRFTNDCSLVSIDRKQFNVKCLKHILCFTTMCISFIACSGLVFGACRYFRFQPRQLLYNDECELRLIQNYDLLQGTNKSNYCCYQNSLISGDSALSSQLTSNHNEEHLNFTVNSSIQHISSQRKIPPFTYEELPPTCSLPSIPLPPLPISPSINLNSKSSNINPDKSALFSSSTSASSSPKSLFSATIIPNTTTSNNNTRKSTLTSEDACATTPTSYTTCECVTDVWERQQRPSVSLSHR